MWACHRSGAAAALREGDPYCNADLRQSTPHWDYITPRSKGGTDSVDNMLWLCDVCNSNKQDMDWLEFLYRYATSLGIDPNKNQKPWQQWMLNRAQPRSHAPRSRPIPFAG